jgi:F-type H+-transporting ATPase subunit a
MIRFSPWLMLAAEGGHGEGHGEGEESLGGVIIHHLSNQDYAHPLLAEWHVTKAVVMMLLAALFLIVFLGVFLRKSRIAGGAPKGITNAIESLALFVRDEIAIANMGKKYGRFFAPYLLTLFFFILTCNLMGLIPGTYTATGNINVTAALALMTLLMMIVAGMIVQGPIGYFKHMVPAGTPMVLAPLLIVIEVISTFVKPIALTIRLGANMSAGHIVILVMLGFLFVFKSILVGLFLSVPLAVAISLLEMIVAFIQAYVFTLLTALFIGMVVHPAH